jgi:sortase (surface protein transpeptidase)
VEPLVPSQQFTVGEARALTVEEIQASRAVQPTRVIAPDLGIDMPVVAVGLDDRNYMEAPFSILEAGWYRYGAAPSSGQGATVIGAHVDMPNQGVGPFANLRNAQAGQEITVTDENGINHVYVVVGVEKIAKGEVPYGEVFSTSGEPRLALITCGGDFDFTARSYTDNYIVTAEKVS